MRDITKLAFQYLFSGPLTYLLMLGLCAGWLAIGDHQWSLTIIGGVLTAYLAHLLRRQMPHLTYKGLVIAPLAFLAGWAFGMGYALLPDTYLRILLTVPALVLLASAVFGNAIVANIPAQKPEPSLPTGE